MRRHLSFELAGATLVATLDEAPGQCGLLWVSGGNEVRSGAFAGQAQLAARVAAAGFPVLRFDRRGTGDSEGENQGFRGSGPDIRAALATLRAVQPQVTRVVAFGNCDAASALMLGAGCGADALVLANPWTFDRDADIDLPASAIRARYASKLSNPSELLRLVKGQISFGGVIRGLARAAVPKQSPTSLMQDMARDLDAFGGPVQFLIAERDRTGQAFVSARDASDPRVRRCPGASHAFVEPAACDWLLAQLLGALADEQARQLDVS